MINDRKKKLLQAILMEFIANTIRIPGNSSAQNPTISSTAISFFLCRFVMFSRPTHFTLLPEMEFITDPCESAPHGKAQQFTTQIGRASCRERV